MPYLHVGDKPPPCQWQGCSGHSSAYVENSTGQDSAFLCKFHKRVAAVNLEQYDRIHAPGKASDRRRPGELVPPAPRQTPRARPGQQEVVVEDWEKKAAENADSSAVQVEKTEVDAGEDQKASAANEIIRPLISDTPKPRRAP